MSWESTAEYYRLINEEVHRRLGGSHSASILMYSFDFQEIEDLQHHGQWDKLGKMLADKALHLQEAGADALVLCTNTMHLLAPEIESGLDIPLLHIADATGKAVVDKQIHTVGLLGTRFTMEEPFYRERLFDHFELNVIVPVPEEREMIHRVIYQELVTGKIWEPSRAKFIEVIKALEKRGAEGVILGCTEIPLLVKQEHSPLPLFDTTAIHAMAAVDFLLEGHQG